MFCFASDNKMMNEEAVASIIINKLAKSGISLNHEDGLDAIRDYFADRDVEDSYSDDDDNDHFATNTSDSVLVDATQNDEPSDVRHIVVTEYKMPEISNVFVELLNDSEEEIVLSYLQDGCGCHLGPNNTNCEGKSVAFSCF